MERKETMAGACFTITLIGAYITLLFLIAEQMVRIVIHEIETHFATGFI